MLTKGAATTALFGDLNGGRPSVVRYRFLWVAIVLAALGCHSSARENPDAFSWSTRLQPGQTVHIRDGEGNITVATTPSSDLRVRASKRWRRGREQDIQFQVRSHGSDVFVCAMWRASGTCDATHYRGKRTESFLSFLSLFHRSTDASASFTVEVPAGIAVDARTTTGDVSVTGVHAGVSARTTNGAVTASGVAGPLALASLNGDIQVAVDSLGAADSIRANTTNGSVRATVPSTLDGHIELSTLNGDAHSDFPVSAVANRARHTYAGDIGTSPRLIRLRTVNGSVALVRTASSVR